MTKAEALKVVGEMGNGAEFVCLTRRGCAIKYGANYSRVGWRNKTLEFVYLTKKEADRLTGEIDENEAFRMAKTIGSTGLRNE